MRRTTLPAGVREQTCSRCGLPVWRARTDPRSAARARWRNPIILLAPHPDEGGNITLNRDGLAVFTGRFPGEYARHHCPATVSTCKYCDEPVRVLAQPPGATETLAVVDADPDPGGLVAVNPAGYALFDPGHTIDGARYRWHTSHERTGDA